MSLTKVSSESVERQEMLGDENINQKRSYIFMKRLIDIVGSFCGIIILLPVFIIVAICIKLEDPKGPVFLNKYVLEKMKKILECINFARW